MMRNYWQAIRSFNRSVWAYFAMWAVIAFAYFGFIGVLQNLYLLRLGYDVESIGLLIAWAVYRYLGLKFLPRIWINLDAAWAASLVLAGAAGVVSAA